MAAWPHCLSCVYCLSVVCCGGRSVLRYDLYLRQEDENKIITESIKELVYVKYVRRELRALDDTDRVVSE